jgi:hypothetical protein
LVDEYSEITDILKEIRKRITCKNVFISGAYEKDETGLYSELVSRLSCWLIEQNYKIYTGYGKNLGADVVAGAFAGCIKSSENKKFNENVFIFPFPYKSEMSPKKRAEYYRELRKYAILNTNVTILINGVKEVDSKEVVSNGCVEEAEIPLEQGNLVIPIACTGGAAEEVWNKINSEVGGEYSLSSAFQSFNREMTTDDIIQTIQEILNTFN